MDIYPATVEYAHITVTSDVVLAGEVQVALLPQAQSPDADTSWLPATWDGDAGTTRTCKVLLHGRSVSPAPTGGVLVHRGLHTLWLLFPDAPERVVRQAPELISGH